MALIVGEGLGRALGLHTPVLFEKTAYGFRPAPDQDVRRFGHRVKYNALGLRGEPAAIAVAPGIERVLCLGDSVTNGGTFLDQSETLPSHLALALEQTGRSVEVLNASSPGWAVANEAGWLDRFGSMGARYLIWILNTSDLFQPMAPSAIVDSHPSFPSHPPVLALQELLQRYLLPRLAGNSGVEDPGAALQTTADAVTSEVRQVLLASLRTLPPSVHPLIVLVVHPRHLEGQEQAVGRLETALRGAAVRLLKVGESVHPGSGEKLYRDGVHPNAAGNAYIASRIAADMLAMRAP